MLPRSGLGKVVAYMLGMWDGLVRFLEDPRIPLDNNAERVLRTVAIGRQNWLFARSDEGGNRAATLYSPIAWVRRHGLDPYAYLRNRFERFPTDPQSRLAEPTPAAWAQALRDPAEAAA